MCLWFDARVLRKSSPVAFNACVLHVYGCASFHRRKLDEKGIGELSFDEVYRALLLGAVPPALVTDAVRLLAAGRPGEESGPAFLSGEASAFLGGGDVSMECRWERGSADGRTVLLPYSFDH